MNDTLQTQLAAALQRRERIGTLRLLQLPDADRDCIDFYSNDYLGLARSKELLARVRQRRDEVAAAMPSVALAGATGSRLISGNHAYFMQVERQLAQFYNSEAALLFNSGYTANLGVLSSLPQANDVILYDELIHNSCHEGMRLSRAYKHNNTQAFKHSDLADLEAKLQAATANSDITDKQPRCVFVVVESVYSMDGDVAPLRPMAKLCAKYPNAYMIIDEAHGVGVFGPHGSGVVRQLSLETEFPNIICCRVYTFGKAMGCHGAVVCGSQVLVNFLVNYARVFIYTTAFPFEQLVTVQCAHELCAVSDCRRRRTNELVAYFKRRVAQSQSIPVAALLPSDSPIQGVVFSGNHAVLQAATAIRRSGIRVIPIRAPTVPRGAERFRIIIHADNTELEIDQLLEALEALFMSQATPTTARL